MAKPQKEQAVWRPSQVVVEKPIVTEGDIYAPLRDLVFRYQQRAEKLMQKAHDCHVNDPDSKRNLGILTAASSYLEQARRVLNLIPEDPSDIEVISTDEANSLTFGIDLASGPDVTVVQFPASVIGASAQ